MGHYSPMSLALILLCSSKCSNDFLLRVQSTPHFQPCSWLKIRGISFRALREFQAPKADSGSLVHLSGKQIYIQLSAKCSAAYLSVGNAQMHSCTVAQ